MHNIQHWTYPEKCDRRKVKAEIDDYVQHEDWQEGCGGLYNPIRWIEDTVYETQDEAEKAIEKLDRRDYDNIAVKFKRPISFTNNKLEELAGACLVAYEEYRAREGKLYPQTLTSAFLGCKKCGSRLAVNMLHTNLCPVCHGDLRPESTRKSIASAKAKWDRAKRKVDEYVKKHAKSEVCWLVKFEYHT